MKQKVTRTDISTNDSLQKLLTEGYVVKHITPIGNYLEYIVEKEDKASGKFVK